jgi:hypothetical protein
MWGCGAIHMIAPLTLIHSSHEVYTHGQGLNYGVTTIVTGADSPRTSGL